MDVKSFKDKVGDNNKNNKFISMRIDDDKLPEKYKPFALWLKI